MHFPLCLLSSYVVNMGLIDKLYGCFLSVQGPVDEQPKMSAFLQQASALLHSMCKLCFVVTGRWACFLLVTHFDIFVISWSSSDNQYTHLSVQVMTGWVTVCVFFFCFLFFFFGLSKGSIKTALFVTQTNLSFLCNQPAGHSLQSASWLSCRYWRWR